MLKKNVSEMWIQDKETEVKKEDDDDSEDEVFTKGNE